MPISASGSAIPASGALGGLLGRRLGVGRLRARVGLGPRRLLGLLGLLALVALLALLALGRRALGFRPGRGVASAVGAVEPAALQHDPDVPEHFAQRAAAVLADRQRLVLERLRDLDVLTAGLADVLVDGHRA